jgi:hypothetical protein
MLMLTKISLGKKISPGTNTPAYFGAASVAKKNGHHSWKFRLQLEDLGEGMMTHNGACTINFFTTVINYKS